MKRSLVVVVLALVVTIGCGVFGVASAAAFTSTGDGSWVWQNPLPQGTTLNAVSFPDATHGWAVGDQGAILVTNDGGKTWAAQHSGTSYRLQGVCFVDDSRGWAVGGDNGDDEPACGLVLVTSDGGAHWTQQDSSADVSSDLYGVSFATASDGWAVGQNGTILATSDGGTTWTSQDSGTSDDLSAVSFPDATHGWVVGGPGVILATSDGGTTWTSQDSGTSDGLGAVSFPDATHGWAVGDQGVILATSDGGTTWTSQSSGTTWALASVSFGDATHGWAVGGVLGAGGQGTIVATSDGGQHWTSENQTAFELMGVSFADPTHGCAVGWAGTTVTSDGTTWTVQSAHVPGAESPSLWGVSFPDDSHGWAVGENGTILATGDGGTTWTSQDSGTSDHLNAVSFPDATHGWAVGENGTILATGDGGTTWTSQSSGKTAALYAVSFANASDGWAVGNYGDILATSDGGATWTSQDSGTTAILWGVACTDATHAWAVGDGDIIATSDGGATWTVRYSNSAADLKAVSFANASDGWAVGNSGEILATSDGGTTWASQDSGTSDDLRSVCFVDATHGWATGGGNGTILRYDGTSWKPQIADCGVGPIALSFPDATHGWAVGSFSMILATAPAPTLIGFAPASGAAGDSVTLSGTGLAGATAVSFSGTAASFTVNSDMQITATVPSGASSGPLSVTTPSGTVTSIADFTVGNTPATTTSETVQLSGGVAVTFPSVSAAGDTTVSESSTDPGTSPAPFQVLGQSFYQIATTASYGTPVTIALPYDPTGLTLSQQQGLELMHYDNGTWVDVTTSVDTTNCIVYGSVDHFSWFALKVLTATTTTLASDAGAPTYGDTVDLTATVSPASATGTVTFYDGAASLGSATLAGGSATLPTTALPAGTDSLTASYGGDTDDLTSASGALSQGVARATLTVTPDPRSLTYGDPVPTYTFKVTGFVNGETDATAAGYSAPTCGSAYTPTTPVSVSPLQIGASGGVATDYVFDTKATANLKIAPALLTITAGNQSKTFGTTLASPTSSAFTTSGLLASDTVTSVTLASPGAGASATPGTYPITPGAAVGSGLTNYTITYTNGALTVVKAPTAVVLTVKPAPTHYSDVATFTATASPATAGGSQLSGSVQFAVAGKNLGLPVAIGTGGVATCKYTVTQATGSYPVTATFTSSNSNFANPSTAASATLAVSPEDASITYSGDTLGTVGSALNLQATVMDSAAVGYSGLNLETGTGKTIGDITRMWIAFVITPVGGTTSTTIYARVLDTGTVGDGIGTASATYKASTEGSYTVLAQLVAGSTGGADQYYSAPDAQPATLNFYTNSGEFVIGGGWVTDPAGAGHGNFGMMARYGSGGKPQGLLTYVWSGTSNGVPAFFTITSNAVTALSFTGGKYPLSATLSGTATLQVNRASNWALLYGPETKLPFTVTAVDTGQSSGVGVDKLSLTLTGSKAPFLTGGMKSFSGCLLKGGNIVIHLK